MRKFNFLVLIAVSASLGGMVWFHQHSLDALSRKPGAILSLHQRQGILATLTLDLERYRRESATFRRMENADITAAKDELKNSFRDGVTQLEAFPDLTPTDREQVNSLLDHVTDLLTTSERIERTMYSKDAYQKEEIRGIHDEIVKTLDNLQAKAEGRIAALSSDAAPPAEASASESRSSRFAPFMLKANWSSNWHSTWIEIALACWIVALLGILLVRNYLVHFRPLQRLLKHAESLRSGRASGESVPAGRLSGVYGEIQSALGHLAQTVETHVKERHKFILDVVADLRHPLTLLQSGKALLGGRASLDAAPEASEAGECAQAPAVDQLRRGLAILSGSLDDLGDLVEISRIDTKLDESVIDLSEMVQDVARSLGGPAFGKQITTSVPAMPIWAKLDQRRVERALIQVIAKVASTLRPGSGINLCVRPTDANLSFRGTEIVVQEQRTEAPRHRGGERNSLTAVSSLASGIQTGPELDLLKHWISERGLSMALVYKVIRAQGGSVTASGAPGSNVRVMIRIPEERISSRGLITAPDRTIEDELRSPTC